MASKGGKEMASKGGKEMASKGGKEMASKGGKDKQRLSLFHFTDKDSAKKIVKSGKIKQSKAGPGTRDAVAGNGVYLTRLRPNEKPVSDIAKNNWDDGTLPQEKIKQGKMDVAIKVKVPEDRVRKANTDRSVYVFEGDVTASKIKEVYVRDKLAGEFVKIQRKK